MLPCLKEAITLLDTEGFVLWGRPDEEGVGMLQVRRVVMWLLIEQWPFPGLCHGLEALHCLVPDVCVSFQQSRNVGLWFLGRLLRGSC